MNEIEALSKIDEVLSNVQDKEAINRIVKWMVDKYSKDIIKDIEIGVPVKSKKTIKKISPSRKTSKTSVKSKNKFSVVKNLELNPEGKQSFKDFCNNKQPNSAKEKYVICVYYLKNVLAIEKVEISHIFTCFKYASWRLPKNFMNMLHQSASTGWLDTGDQSNIQMTTIGDNLVEHDLPKSKNKRR